MVDFLIQAIENINNRRNSGDSEFINTDNLYMISPIFLTPTFKKINTLNFFKKFGFETTIFEGKDLENKEYLKNNSEAQLADNLFGHERTKNGHKKSVARIKIGFDKINSKEFERKKKMVQKGIKLLLGKQEKSCNRNDDSNIR